MKKNLKNDPLYTKKGTETVSLTYFRNFPPHFSTSSGEPVLAALGTIVPHSGIFLQCLAKHLESKSNWYFGINELPAYWSPKTYLYAALPVQLIEC